MRQAIILLATVLAVAACEAGSEPVADEPAGAAVHEDEADTAEVDDEEMVDALHVTVRAVDIGPYEGLPETLPAGLVTFAFEQEDPNARATHDFRIEELDVGTPILPRGRDAELTVELAPGTYTVYCSVGNHRVEGMEGEFVVEDSGDG